MARSKCPSCQSHSFAMVENEPRNSNFKIMLIQCSQCGTVVGTTSYYDAGVISNGIDKKIDDLKSQISYLQDAVNQINYKIK